jgi:hypothetical protein
MKTVLSYSGYSRQVIALDNGRLNYSSILIFPFSGSDVRASEAPILSKVKEEHIVAIDVHVVCYL